ncbi:hypothetical protein [Haloquadratum walsbyi]|uniref:Uncharacterized protein n=1 Tax=Haloquadratum walsbyi J07HQW2 TaxID=1238425 RepID=U1PLM2_9EURY|nr:hypothetical protein [Haloquadratum walsbyi]ERG94602.1 MAG: hypothetical protein J07HQW2_01038 [Haloquadratum walsbyi J07HQW2]
MEWHRRKDLEGGKELGVWLCRDETGTVTEELYVESHEYRGGDFDTYTATPTGEWTHLGSFKTSTEAFAAARSHIDSTSGSLITES